MLGGVRKSVLVEAARRRRVLPGYPVPPQPMCVEEADAYLASEPMICLLCGRGMNALARHLAYIHALTTDAYRELYGLPYSLGLNTPSTRARRVQASTERRHRPPHHEAQEAAGRGVLKPLALRGRERKSHYLRLRAIARLRELNRLPPGFRFGREHLQQFLARAATGLTFKEVASDPDMPSVPWVEIACRRWPDLYGDFVRAVELLPFTVQARLHRLGPRFAAAVADLHRRGHSLHAIARRLGVAAMSVHRRVRVLRDEELGR